MKKAVNKVILINLITIFILTFTSCSNTSEIKKSDHSVNSIAVSSSSVSVNSSTESQQNSSSTTPPASSPKIIDGFVKLTDLDPDFIIDLKYATTDNFTHTKVYPTDICVLRIATAEKLVKANAEFKTMGYRLKIWDAYRPLSVQEIFWNIDPDPRFVADPATGGSVHNRGCAVDVTLVDENGNDLVMPSSFDDFTDAAYPNNPNMSSQAKADLNILTKGMTDNGFVTITTEWWHFEDSNWQSYPISNVDLTQFE